MWPNLESNPGPLAYYTNATHFKWDLDITSIINIYININIIQVRMF